MVKHINRIKAVLAERRKTNLWLAHALGKNPVTIFQWYSNSTQPTLETRTEIAICLNAGTKLLLNSIETTIAYTSSVPYINHERK